MPLPSARPPADATALPRLLALGLALPWAPPTLACSACAPLVRARIQGDDFFANLVLVLLPLVVLALAVACIHVMQAPGSQRRAADTPTKKERP